MNLRRLRMGLATVLGLRAHGFFIPYRYAAQVAPADRRNYVHVAENFAGAAREFAAVIDLTDSYQNELRAIAPDAPPPAPRWQQDWFPALDGAVLYALIRHHRPPRIIEIGSGHSTRFIARALADGDLGTEVTAIDPAPRAAIDSLPVTIVRQTVQHVAAELLGSISAGDFLIVDSSHILMPGSDVDIVLNDIMTQLPAGALIHIHDVFLPDPYPPAWAWRGYNEQTAIAALLGPGSPYAPIFASHYARQRFAERLTGSVINDLPRPAGAFETSLWLRKTRNGA